MYTAEKKNTDLLIVGAGLTGLRAALLGGGHRF